MQKTFIIVLFCCLFIIHFSHLKSTRVPVFVMMPLTVVSNEGQLNNPSKIRSDLQKLKYKDADGIMVDVWWGIVERKGPKQYNFQAYKELANIVRDLGMKMQVVMSFHRCGGNVGDDCYIPLPNWVLEIGRTNGHIFYTDKNGHHNSEYLSLGVDHEKLFHGRSAVEMYADFMTEFRNQFSSFLGNVITTIEVGLGPAGELRYPSYQLDRWNFPGQGEFQCYDKYMLAMLKQSAQSIGRPEWGNGGPSNAGDYNQYPIHSGSFFTDGFDNWNTPYGKFFLSWYSGALIKHGDDILGKAAKIFSGTNVVIAAKIAGIHWWYLTHSHAAELTAGYYNTIHHNGYDEIAKMMKKHNVEFQFTCLEMKDSELHGCQCSPERLVYQTRSTAWYYNLKYSGENALPITNESQFDQVVKQSYYNGKAIDSFTLLRLNDALLSPPMYDMFGKFVQKMHNIHMYSNSTR